jgi:hypothetical protein
MKDRQTKVTTELFADDYISANYDAAHVADCRISYLIVSSGSRIIHRHLAMATFGLDDSETQDVVEQMAEYREKIRSLATATEMESLMAMQDAKGAPRYWPR